MTLLLAISAGDPAGIGPEVALRAVSSQSEAAAVIFGDAERLEALALVLGLAPGRTRRVAVGHPYDLPAGAIGLAHVASASDETVAARAPTVEGGAVQLAALDAAIDCVREGRARALVTGPTSKEAISMARASAGGRPFVGQTEHLARRSELADDTVTMMFLGPTLRVALVTTHLAIRDASSAITEERVARTIAHLSEALVRLTERGRKPRILVTGLNPHAGEGGLFGDEEERAILPGIRRASHAETTAGGGVEIVGLAPAESAFRSAARGDVDGVVAMLHDQATIASKLLDWGEAVNVTWGLPFVRTSVDHGVAYAAAADGTADARGMSAALRMAVALT
jgi:4-hydroxythreonine-4-phosphate dehydrogenase